MSASRFYKIVELHKLCKGCAYQITTVHGNKVSDRCIKYLTPVRDIIVYELTSVVRNDHRKCGPSGQYYQKCSYSNPHPYNQNRL